MSPDDDRTDMSRSRVAPVRPVGREPKRSGRGASDMLQVRHECSAPRKTRTAGRLGIAPKARDKARNSSIPMMVMTGARTIVAIVTPITMCMVLVRPGGISR